MKVAENITVDWRHNANKNKTICAITVGDKQVIGMSVVHRGDAYNKKIGRKLSLTRALTKTNEEKILSKEERTNVWNVLREKGIKLV